MLRTHRAGKGPGGCGWGDLGSTEPTGPRRASCLWSQRAGDPTWEPSRFPRLEWVGQTSFTPLPLFPSRGAPPSCLSSSPPASLLCPQNQHGPEGPSESIGPGPRAGQTSPADREGKILGMLPPDLSPRGSLQAWEPLPPLSHPSGVLLLSSLHFSSPLSPATSYQFPWGFLLSPWASRSLTSIWQAY